GAFVATSGGAAEFLSPPEIGNRTIGLSWTADTDDAVFTGNIVLEVDAEYPFIHGVDRPVVDIVSFSIVRELLSYADGERELKRWNRDTGEVLQTVPISSLGNPVDLTIHGSNRYALAAYDDGSVEFWDLEENPDSSRTAQVSPLPLRRVEFLPRVQDESDFRFIAAGEENLVYYMSAIGSTEFTMTVPGGGVEAIAISPNGAYLVTGGVDARLRVWKIDDGRPDSPLSFFVTHPGTIKEIAVDPTSTRMVSVDETGHVIISLLRTGQILGEFDTVVTGGRVATPIFSLPDGAVLSVAQPNGVITVRDGFTGREYLQREVSPDGISAFTMGSDGLRTVLGDPDGKIRVARAGRCIPSASDPICFGGYKIWRNTVPDSSGAVLMREFRFDSDTWTLTSGTHHFVDPDSLVIRVAPPGEEDEDDELRRSGPHNGVPYFYSVTRFDRHYFQGSVFDVNQNSVIEGSTGTRVPSIPRRSSRRPTPGRPFRS
ncbi:MAG: WD40 repeat domain-containing protein, partial [Candidatus Eisenbacteria bacterium]